MADNPIIGWTPFLVAVHRRHWDTARLVIAIANAQYQPPDAGANAEATPLVPTSSVLSDCKHSFIVTFPMAFSLILHVADDSDEEGYDSDDSDEDYEYEQEINFTDVAARPSVVRAKVSAEKMLRLAQDILLEAGDKHISCNPLEKAVYEDDFETFVRTVELYEFVGVALWSATRVHELAVALDRPDMLDELMRRTGVGIPYYPSDTLEGHQQNLKKDIEERRVYLGLKVGGKRRADSSQDGPRVLRYNYDLLRSAITRGSGKIVEYLAGPRPLAAYTYYAATHSGDVARYLKSFENLGAVLSDHLGWQVDELNESPLLSAVIHDKIDILKQLFVLKPNLMEEALHQRYGSPWTYFVMTVLITRQDEVGRIQCAFGHSVLLLQHRNRGLLVRKGL